MTDRIEIVDADWGEMAGRGESGDHAQDLDPTPEDEVSTYTGDMTGDVTQIYLNEIGMHALLTPEEERELTRKVVQGDLQARKTMIERNLRLVVSIARHYMNRDMAFMDLIEEGNIGLMHALEKFDPELGYRFSTYASWWIREHIERAIMMQSRTIHLPTFLVKKLHVYLRTRRYLEASNGRTPSIEEIAHFLRVDVLAVRQIMDLSDHTVSLDMPLDIDPMLTIGESIADEQYVSPEITLHKAEIERYMHEWLRQLSDRHRDIIEKRYGLNGCEICTLEVIAANLGVTRERVRQIQIEALQRLRQILQRYGVSREAI